MKAISMTARKKSWYNKSVFRERYAIVASVILFAGMALSIMILTLFNS